MSELIGLFSGGRDSLTACHVAGVKEVLYCHTGIGLNEPYVIEACKKLGWKLNILYPKNGDDEYEIFIKKYGFPKPTNHSWIMHNLKSKPVDKWCRADKRDKILISGIRRKESKKRQRMFKDETMFYQGKLFKYPILTWSKKQVHEYIKKHNLPQNPFYKTMGISSDCFCGAFSSPHENLKLIQHHKELADRIAALEKKYGLKWGKQSGIYACGGQKTLEGLLCSECQIE